MTKIKVIINNGQKTWRYKTFEIKKNHYTIMWKKNAKKQATKISVFGNIKCYTYFIFDIW